MAELTGGRIPCGDCSAPDPDWASTNRGLLLCNDCCFIHRSLGPQYSHIKSLKDADWDPALRAMVLTLAGGGANHVWEHLLLDRSKAERDFGVKKPFPYDTLEVKRKFIQLKHFQFAFVPRPSMDQIEVKSQELHSTVRTASVDTTLRLLAGGADPNYFHPMKGTRPIHVAARNGQASQVELLHLHGAHPAAPDYLGQTPMEHAIAAGHKDLAQRLLQLRYALTDQLTYFVCQEAPDHLSTKHILVPSIKAKSPKHEADISNLASYLLEQLAADLLDEVGRRQIERVIVKKFGSESPKFSIAFLPVNPHYPSVRNQARQKFARLTDPELCSMISGVLSETEKRHRRSGAGGSGSPVTGANSDAETIFRRLSASPAPPAASNGNGQQTKVGRGSEPPTASAILDDDDYPLYDSVASDEDIILAEQQLFLAQEKYNAEKASIPITSSSSNSNLNGDPTSSSTLSQSRVTGLTDYKEKLLLSRLMETESEIKELSGINNKLQRECQTLEQMVKSSLKENLELIGRIQTVFTTGDALNCSCGAKGGRTLSNKSVPRPSSMVELLPNPPPMDGAIAAIVSSSHEHLKPSPPPPKIRNSQEATLRIVDLIKELMSSTIKRNIPEIKRTSHEISKVVNDFTRIAIGTNEARNNPNIMNALEKLCFHALKLEHEILALISSSTITPDSELVTAVKKLCLEVGAAMREVVFMLPLPDHEETKTLGELQIKK